MHGVAESSSALAWQHAHAALDPRVNLVDGLHELKTERCVP